MYTSALVVSQVWSAGGVRYQCSCRLVDGSGVSVEADVPDLSIGAAAIQAAIQVEVAAQLTALGFPVTDAEVVVLGGAL